MIDELTANKQSLEAQLYEVSQTASDNLILAE